MRAPTILFAFIGVILLSCWAFLHFDSVYHQWRYERVFDEIREGNTSADSNASTDGNTPAVSDSKGPVARIEVPRLGVSAMVLEGIDDVTLRRAVGHVPGTGLLGKPGNVVLAGHRDTFFRALRGIQKQDEIRLETATGVTYRYRVESIRVVGPKDVSVLKPSRGNILTLLTCYPFDFTGPAPQRFIVRARQRAVEGVAN